MNKNLCKFTAAVFIYASFAFYLYQPYFKHFDKLQRLVLVNVCLAAVGSFVLSRRWVASFWGSFFTGAIYGFGPFVLGLAKYHPTAVLITAGIPWLFCPAVFGPKAKWQWLRIPFSAIPFLAIVLFFQITAHFRLFAIPIQSKLHLADLVGLLAPLATVTGNLTLIGFYHVPVAALVMGLSMLLTARRFSIMIIFAIGTVLAFCNPILDISPIIWLALPVLCCSVITGIGLQGLASAGFADKKWVMMTTIIMLVLSLVTLLLATKYFEIFAGLGDKYGKLFTETAKMYILGAIPVAIVFFMVRAKLRLCWLRWIFLCSAAAADIFLGAGFIVDRIF